MWEAKNSSDENNESWIKVNTKECPNPKCKLPIEKNQGCNHMNCKKCGFHFCWKCMQKWEGHGDFYNCKFEGEMKHKN